MIASSLLVAACALASDVEAAPRAPGLIEGGAVFVGPSIDFSLAIPARGATMPKNARLIVFGQFFDEQSQPTGEEQDVHFDRVMPDGERVRLSDVETHGTSLNGRAYLVDLGDLVAGETVTVTCDLCFDEWSATVVDAVDDRPPFFPEGNKNRVAVTDMGEGVGYQVRACVPMPIDREGGNLALRVITDARDGYAPAVQGGGIGGCALDEIDVAAFADGDARRFCFQTLAVDGAGNEALFHENVCAELPEHTFAPQGCAQTRGASAPIAFLGLAAFIALTRRESPSPRTHRSTPARTTLARSP